MLSQSSMVCQAAMVATHTFQSMQVLIEYIITSHDTPMEMAYLCCVYVCKYVCMYNIRHTMYIYTYIHTVMYTHEWTTNTTYGLSTFLPRFLRALRGYSQKKIIIDKPLSFHIQGEEAWSRNTHS